MEAVEARWLWRSCWCWRIHWSFGDGPLPERVAQLGDCIQLRVVDGVGLSLERVVQGRQAVLQAFCVRDFGLREGVVAEGDGVGYSDGQGVARDVLLAPIVLARRAQAPATETTKIP